MYKSIFYLIGEKNRIRFFLLLPIMLIGSLLEMAGVGLLVSICALLMNGERVRENSIVLWICGRFGLQSAKELIIFILLCLAALYIFKFLYLSWENYIVSKFVRLSRSDTAARLFRQIIRAPYTFFVRRGTAEIQTLLGRDMDQFGTGLTSLMQLLIESLVAFGMGIFLLLVDPLMTSFAAAGIIILLLITRLILNRIIQRASQNQRAANRARWTWIHQSVAGIKDIRIGRHEDFFSCRFEDANDVFSRTEYMKQFWTKLPALCVETIVILSVLAYLLFLTFGGADLSHYLPGLSALVLAAVRLLPSCSRINTSLTQLGYARTAVESICRSFEETEPKTDEHQRREVDFSSGISLKDVSYTYEGSAETVLTQVDMDIPVGSSVGIVGPSGTGKTTLLDILLGLLTPEQGQVLVDGVPIDQCYESYLRKTAYVPQNTFLLDGTIRDNVAMGEEPANIDDERVWSALRDAALAETVRRLPHGLDTQIGEQGIRLSGGERQRLGLAQALYRNPSLIVFDEATSALDLETEAEIMNSISRLRGTRTLVIVSHRKSTISGCDRVYRVEDGKAVRER